MGWTERALFIAGCALLTFVLGAYMHRAVMYRAAMKSFEHAREKAAATRNDTATSGPTPADETIQAATNHDTDRQPARLSSAQSTVRHRGFDEVPLAILRIPKVHLEVPVLVGTDDFTLNRGVGQIAGTAAPGEKGNIGIAGHRDGFFRDLKDITVGDRIELETTGAVDIYTVDSILVTSPDDVSVLRARKGQSLTLVTCFPFRFVGPAPRRFVVEASVKR
jgi:sortase A